MLSSSSHLRLVTKIARGCRGSPRRSPRALFDGLTVLNERERRILATRRLAEEPITLAELAEEFGVSRERVRQIEVSAFEKVKNAVKHVAMRTPAPLQMLSFRPSPVAGETDDGRVAVGNVLRQPNDARGAPLTAC
jgi:hypothetical protein